MPVDEGTFELALVVVESRSPGLLCFELPTCQICVFACLLVGLFLYVSVFVCIFEDTLFKVVLNGHQQKRRWGDALGRGFCPEAAVEPKSQGPFADLGSLWWFG